jgi:hypothetical protein
MYNQQWNLTVQRSITTNTLFELAYAGNKGTHLPLSVNLDQLPNADESQGSSLLQLVTNPFYGHITTGPMSQPTVEAGLLETPFPAWNGVSASEAAAADSEYNALQALLQKRFASGNSFTVAYTWSKLMSDGMDGVWAGNNPIRNWYCIRCEHSPSAYDVPSRLVLSGVSRLPFGRGERWGSNWRGFTDTVLGGWQANGILTFGSGQPLVFSSSGNSYSFGGTQTANLTGINPSAGSAQGINEWFNPAAFAVPANFTFGNLDRTFTAVRQDWTRDCDLSLFKNFKIKEWAQLQFRAEAYNLTNTVVFGAPNTTVGSPSFGVISGQANSPRSFQLALKVIF